MKTPNENVKSRRFIPVPVIMGACVSLLAVDALSAEDKGKPPKVEKPVPHDVPVPRVRREHNPEPVNNPVIKEGAKIKLHGKLMGGMAGIGGETTGWLLSYETKKAKKSIEVDVTGLDPKKVPQGKVTVSGKIYKKNYIERGPTLILKAKTIEAEKVEKKK